MYNFLNTPMEIGFLVNGQMHESLKVLLQPKQIFVIPLEFLENKTDVRFSPSNEKMIFDEQIDVKYHQLDTLMCD